MVPINVFVLVGGLPTAFGHRGVWPNTIWASPGIRNKELVQISPFFMVFGKVLIWRMGPGPTWVGPAPRCGHPGGRVSPPASTGRRPGRPGASAGCLNCISEVTTLLKNKESKAAGAGINFPGQLQRWVRQVRPGRASAAAQVGWKAHLDGI